MSMRSRVIYLCWLAILWRNRTGSGSLAHVIGVAEACQCQRKPFVLRTRARQQRLHEGLPVAVRSDRAPKWVGSGGMVSAQCLPAWNTRKSCDVHVLLRADCILCILFPLAPSNSCGTQRTAMGWHLRRSGTRNLPGSPRARSVRKSPLSTGPKTA